MAVNLRQASFTEDTPVKVSICTVAFNHEAYMQQCIESLLDQECEFRVEIIIHDDASTDRTADIIREYQETYPETVRSVLQRENQYSKGVNPQYNYVFPKAQGEFIAVCDGDDYWCDPKKLAKQIEVLEQNPDIAVTFGRVKADGDDGIEEEYRNGAEHDLSSLDLKRGMPINTSTACYRNVFQEPPPYLKYAPIGDMTVWAVLGYLGRGKFISEIERSGYRVHVGGIFSKQSLRNQRFMSAMTLLAMAAYHNQKGDKYAMRACLKRLLGLLIQLNGVSSTLALTLRKSVSIGIQKLQGK